MSLCTLIRWRRVFVVVIVVEGVEGRRVEGVEGRRRIPCPSTASFLDSSGSSRPAATFLVLVRSIADVRC